jgi:hypothetical protein
VGGSGKRVGHAGDGSMGYRLDLQPEPNWPGLSAEAGHLHADTSAMTDVAKRLVAAAEQVEQIPDPLVGTDDGVLHPPQSRYGNRYARANHGPAERGERAVDR